MTTILEKDRDLRFPHFIVLKASAGSGKTYNLTRRFVQFLLSGEVRRSGLGNMLAITFSNNAAKEMKGRTLSWLKKLYFGKSGTVKDILEITSLDAKSMQEKSGLLIQHILENYSDFQVKTIDSFMTSVFKASAIDFGYSPDFEVLLGIDSLMDFSFDIFMRSIREGTPEAAFLDDIVDSLLDQKKSGESYLWDPSAVLLEEIKKIYSKLSSGGKKAGTEDHAEDIKTVTEKMSETLENIEKEIEGSGLNRHRNSSYKTVLPLVREKSFPDLIGKGFANPPVSRPQKGNTREEASYERILALWKDTEELVQKFAAMFAYSRCVPYVKAYQSFSDTVETIKKQQGKVFIEDINMHLAEYLESSIVPDVYLRLGETIFHFLIDEFQDTSPIQWRNLFPLIENSLSQGGSLFTVGDTKQAIYGFRNADYAIMKGLETNNPFPSAVHDVRELAVNYRSKKRILDFNERVFKDILPQNAEYRCAGEKSGLTQYIQKPKEEEKDEGYAEVSLLDSDEEPPERKKVQELIKELKERGYDYKDVAVLTQANEDAVNVTTWLNEINVPFISYSSLDVRRRKITGEIVALMNFLDAPTDDLSFGTFILGDVFTKAVSKEYPGTDIERLRKFCFSNRANPPLYKAFQTTFGELWARYFDGLFKSAGFLPVYDLVTEILALFRVFENIPDEEAAIVKILEVVKDFEGGGFNSIRDFLSTALDDDSGKEWEMAVPIGTDAVKVMTIHKAKGLGFPVVIVLLYEVRNRGFEYLVEEKGDDICLLKINKSFAGCDKALQDLYAQERMKEMVNRLNSLYVGFTRPERELYVVGVKSRDETFPFVLLPRNEFLPHAKAALEPIDKKSAASIAPASSLLHHRGRLLEFSAGSEELMNIKDKRRGEFFHKVLSYIDYARYGERALIREGIRLAREATGDDYPDEETEAVIMALIGNPAMEGYFREAPGRKIRKEQEYSDGAGRLFRMDRVVIDPDRVTVIDYKTGKGGENLEKYRAQMNNYMRILSEIYPGKAVSGIIGFIDSGEAVSIR